VRVSGARVCVSGARCGCQTRRLDYTSLANAVAICRRGKGELAAMPSRWRARGVLGAGLAQTWKPVESRRPGAVVLSAERSCIRPVLRVLSSVCPIHLHFVLSRSRERQGKEASPCLAEGKASPCLAEGKASNARIAVAVLQTSWLPCVFVVYTRKHEGNHSRQELFPSVEVPDLTTTARCQALKLLQTEIRSPLSDSKIVSWDGHLVTKSSTVGRLL